MKNFVFKIGSAIRDYVRETDKMLLVMAIMLSILSCTLQYSLATAGAIQWRPFYMQIASSCVGIVAAIIISLIDYHTLAKLWKLYVPIILILIGLTLFTPLGSMRNGDGMGSDDRILLNIGFMDIQPFEFLKLGFILTFSLHASSVRDHINQPKTLLFLILHGLVPIGLGFLSGDYGTMLVFILIFLCILFTSGLSWKLILPGFGAAVIAGFVFFNFVMDDYLQKRFLLSDEYLYENRLGDTLQQYWGKITLGSGQLTGKGLLSDKLITTTPELYNDFIFAHVGQVFGFVGCIALVIWIMVMCIKLIINARSADDPLGSYISVGVFAVLFFQSVINIGMVLCVLPVIGIPLPFVSAGGTSALTTYMILGLALSVRMNTTKKDHLF